jgi:undecaprenyl-phosphate galactose phosphotransferase
MKNNITKILLITIDILFLIVLFYIASYTLSVIDHINIEDFTFVILIVWILLYSEGIYATRYDFWQETFKVLKSFALAYLIVISLLALLKVNLDYSRLFISIYFVMGMILFPIMKRYSKKIIYSFDIFRLPILVLGQDDQVDIFKTEFAQNWYLGCRYDEINYKNVIITTKDIDATITKEEIGKYLNQDVKLYVVPYITSINFAHSNIMEYSNIRFNAIEVENKLLIKKNIIIKDIFDRLVVLMLLPFLFVVHGVISLLIRFDSSGEVLFKQKRLGKDDEDFKCYKYRTMYTNGDDVLSKYLQENPDEIEYYKEFHKYQNDPRITKVGRFLRSTSLDELPQMINILQGKMSLVGPRPYMLNEDEKLGDIKHTILKVKPGITGLWQVSGRNELTFKERNELEVYYIQNWSLWLDFVILVKTVKVVLGKVGAR